MLIACGAFWWGLGLNEMTSVGFPRWHQWLYRLLPSMGTERNFWKPKETEAPEESGIRKLCSTQQEQYRQRAVTAAAAAAAVIGPGAAVGCHPKTLDFLSYSLLVQSSKSICLAAPGCVSCKKDPEKYMGLRRRLRFCIGIE